MNKSVLVALVMTLFSVGVLANERKGAVRSGNVSFGGIQVKITVDATNELFRIGESEFKSKISHTSHGRVMSGNKRVGIMTWDETLTATIFLDGGDGGNVEGFQEYNCDDIRVTIVRLKDDGTRTIIKNECAFLSDHAALQ